MVRSETPEPAGAEQSLGDLVALAAKDMSQLIRYEIDLAKTELSADVRRIGMAVVLVAGAAFAGCLVLVILCFAYAEGLVVLGLPRWAAFLVVAGTLVLLAVIALGIALAEGAEHVRPTQDARIRHRRLRDAAARGRAPQRPATRAHRAQDPVR